MKYLITGITGFVGPHLANLLLEKGHEVFGLVRCSNGRQTDILDVISWGFYNNIEFIYGNLTNRDAIFKIFKEYTFDGVFHLGAQSHPPTSFADPLDTFNNNIMGSANIIDGIVEHSQNTKLMFCSTSEVYGNCGQDGRKIKITDTILPANPYGVSKAATDLYLQERISNGKIKGFVTRAFSHTGPRRGKNFSISSDAYQLACMKKSGKRELLIGNLSTTRVVTDVRDIVRAYYLLMINENTNMGVFNVCGDIPRKMKYFTDKLIEFSGLKVEKIIHKPYWRPHDIFYQNGDIADLKNLTGWRPTIDIDDTLQELLDYWERKIE